LNETHHIYLLPGFFGFINFGRLVYFGHVREALERWFDGRGIPCEIHRIRVSPTASLRTRAAQILEGITTTSTGGPIHLIGHSTGGLDARLLCTPGVALKTNGVPVEEVARRVRTVVSVSAPHYGTPLATFFTGMFGQKLLRLLSLVTVAILRQGRLPLGLMAQLASTVARLGLPGSQTGALLDHMEAELLGRIDAEEREPMAQFLSDIGADQGLLPQLTPDGIDLFNATAEDRPGVRYGCVVSKGKRPTMMQHLAFGPRPTRQATFLLYRWLHGQTSNRSTERLPKPNTAQRDALIRFLGSMPQPDDNDGVVPTYSQLWGEIIYAAQGDHLDLIGHFRDPHHQPPHHDWLDTGSGFDRHGFEALWNSVSAFLAPDRPRRWWRGFSPG
jgi:triacylglycerol lipase